MRMRLRSVLAPLAFLGWVSIGVDALIRTDASSTCYQRSKINSLPNYPCPMPLRNGRNETPRMQRSRSQQQRRLSMVSSMSGGAERSPTSGLENLFSTLQSFYRKNSFLVSMVVAVTLARLFPSVGKSGGFLRPELFIGKFGVTFIFLLSGLSLELSELQEAISKVRLNAAIQLAGFGAWPLLVGLPTTHALRTLVPNLLPPSLLDGILILTCLPTTVNMCIFLTSAAGGNVATALCNAVISNLGGIFVTPALLLRFLGANIRLPFLQMMFKLCNKVLLPVAVGQILRKTKVKQMYESNKKQFKQAQELILISIVWNAFCDAFSKTSGLALRHALVLLALVPTLHAGSVLALLKVFGHKRFGLSRAEVVAAMFCASQKTLAFGLPLINTVFEGSPDLAAYCAPIMVVHPIQLILGSLLVPRLSNYTEEDRS